MRAPELDLVPGVTDDPHVVDLAAFGALVVDLRRRLNAGLGSHTGDERPLLRGPIPVRGAGLTPFLVLGAFLHAHREPVSLNRPRAHGVTARCVSIAATIRCDANNSRPNASCTPCSAIRRDRNSSDPRTV